jgi:phosphoenolpyruvate carboxykinase (ATP)
LHYIANASESSLGGSPKNVIMLTCDAFGVLPPISLLSPSQAMYHFLSGFTSKVAGTERGVTEPQPTFSACFGAPFMPRRPEVYGNLLKAKIAKHDAKCWLVNTGWTGGAYGEGTRMPIQATRKLLTAALTGEIFNGDFRIDENFNLQVPISVNGVNSELLNPRATWKNSSHYDEQAQKLIAMFAANFEQYLDYVDESIKSVVLQ